MKCRNDQTGERTQSIKNDSRLYLHFWKLTSLTDCRLDDRSEKVKERSSIPL